MKINTINNQNFGKLYIDKEIKLELMQDILKNPLQDVRALKEALACLVEVSQSKTRDMYIDKDGFVSYMIPELKGKTYQDMSGNSLAGKLLHTLERLRSEKLQEEIRKCNNLSRH